MKPFGRLALRCGLIICCLAGAAGLSHCFDTWSFWGGKAHLGFMQEALTPLGLAPDRIAVLTVGADSQDVPMDRKFTESPQNHFDDNKIAEGSAYLRDRMEMAMRLARDAWKQPAVDGPGPTRGALYALGEGMHTAQDFYCHTNYLELRLREKQPLQPVDYGAIPPQVHSGVFYFKGLTDNEGTAMPAAPDNLVNDGPAIKMEQMPTDPMAANVVAKRAAMLTSMGGLPGAYSDVEFERRLREPTYEGALAYVTSERAFLHYECAKDGPTTLQGRIISPSGETLFTLATKLATAATAQQWRRFEDMIRKDPEQAAYAAWTLAALKGKPAPAVSVLAIEPKSPVRPGAKISGTARVRLQNLKGLPADGQNPLRLRIKVAGLLSKGFQRGEYLLGASSGGVGDGTYEVPLEKLGLLAPDDDGDAALKLEVTLEGDPTTHAALRENGFLVETPVTGNVLTFVTPTPAVPNPKLTTRIYGSNTLPTCFRLDGDTLVHEYVKDDGEKVETRVTFDTPPPRYLRIGQPYVLRITRNDARENMHVVAVGGAYGGSVPVRMGGVTEFPFTVPPGAAEVGLWIRMQTSNSGRHENETADWVWQYRRK